MWSRNPALCCTFHTQPEECDSEQIFVHTSPLLIHYKYDTYYVYDTWLLSTEHAIPSINPNNTVLQPMYI